MVTTLYLIRHGETEGAEQRRYKGSIDVPLSEDGGRQIRRLAVQLTSLTKNERGATDLKAVYASDLIRAIRSAELVAAPHGLIPVVFPALRERNFGIWEGMTFDEIRNEYPEEFDSWAGNPLKFSPMGGETTLEVRDRVLKALDEILSVHAGHHIAVVSHGGVNRIILCHFLGVPLENIFRIEQDYGALNIVEFHDRYPVVRLVNGTLYGKI